MVEEYETPARRPSPLPRIVLYALLSTGLLWVPLIFGPAPWLGSAPLRALGMMTALLAYGILCLQPVVAGRWAWVERPFGQDALIRFHRMTGITVLALAIAHPLLLAAGGRGVGFLLTLDQRWPLLLGKALFILLLSYGLAAMLHEKVGVPFQLWYRAHGWGAPLLIAAAFLHAWFQRIGGTSPELQAALLVLTGIALLSWLRLEVVVPLVHRAKPHDVVSVREVAESVWELVLRPPRESAAVRHLPGQFMFLTLLRGRGLPVEEHPFTISSAPGAGEELAVTVKESGDYTATIGETRPGERAAVWAPFGRFSYLLKPPASDTLMVAGGIGITPILSMLRHMRREGVPRRVLLVYAAKRETDLAYIGELRGIQLSGDPPDLEVVPVLSRPEGGWSGHRGRITRPMLEDLLRRPDGQPCLPEDAYICGPPPMMESVEAQLTAMGVPQERIYSERFSL